MIEIYDDETIVGLFGPVGRKDYDDTADVEKPGLLAWARQLRSLSDGELESRCLQAVSSAAQANANLDWRNPAHARVSACNHESRNRWMTQGHDRRCMGPTIYSRAYDRAVAARFGEEGPARECTCGKGE